VRLPETKSACRQLGRLADLGANLGLHFLQSIVRLFDGGPSFAHLGHVAETEVAQLQ